MMNTTTKPTWLGNPYHRAANPNRKISIAAAGVLLATLSVQAFAVPTCSAYNHFVGFNSSTLFFGCGSILFF